MCGCAVRATASIAWRQVHTDDVEVTFRHESRHSAWPTPNIGEIAADMSLDQLDEGHQKRLIDRAFCR